tara:strand:- start:5246 stop:5941 length:696 start_codon:yes stop_codon:yes gene_type:complete
MIEWKDDNDIFGRMLVLTNNPLFNNLRNAVDNHDADLSDALSWGQLKSKRWLVDELEKIDLPLGTIFLCAGWYATLAAMLFQSKCNIDKIRSFDIDESCLQIADTINRNQVKEDWKFKSITQDIMDIDYNKHEWQIWSNTNNRMNYPITDTPNTIINTSCEHIENFEEWYAKIPSGKLVILQSNNFFEVDEHVNCVNDINEFKRMSPMNTVLYSGELQLPKYYRFMLIGYR